MQEMEVRKMYVDVNRLRGFIAARGMTQQAVAHAIGVNNSTFIRKMKCNGEAFSVCQMHMLADILKLSPEEAADIFLCSSLR